MNGGPVRPPQGSQHPAEDKSALAPADGDYVRSEETTSMIERDKGQNAETSRFNAHLFERMRVMHRAWIQQVQEIRQLELDYGHKLLAAENPEQAASLCNEWMAKRMAIIAHEQEMFANSWVWLLADLVGSPTKPAQLEY
jgi:hypothetical protein